MFERDRKAELTDEMGHAHTLDRLSREGTGSGWKEGYIAAALYA